MSKLVKNDCRKLVLDDCKKVQRNPGGCEPCVDLLDDFCPERNVLSVQTLDGVLTGGTYTLTINGETTAPIDWDATPAEIAAALELLAGIGSGNVNELPDDGDDGWRLARLYFTPPIKLTTYSADGSGATFSQPEAEVTIGTRKVTNGRSFGFWKVELQDVELNPTFTDEFGGTRTASGSVNRTFYLAGIGRTDEMVSGELYDMRRNILGGVAFPAPISTTPGTVAFHWTIPALGVDEDGTWIKVAGEIRDDGAYPGYGGDAPIAMGPEDLIFHLTVDGQGPSGITMRFFEGAALIGKTCRSLSPVTIPNNLYSEVYTQLIFGLNGRAIVTPCPRPPFSCDGTACASVASDDETLAGMYTFDGVSMKTYPDSTSGTIYPGLPLGPTWQWVKDDNTLYVWFDGQDWQSSIWNASGLAMISVPTPAIVCETGELISGPISLERLGATIIADTIPSDDGKTATVEFTEDCEEPCVDPHDVSTSMLTDQANVWFNGMADFPTGNYRVKYLEGAGIYSDGSVGPAQGFRINAGGYGFYVVDHAGGGTSGGGVQAPGDSTEYGTQAEAEAANEGAYVDFVHTGPAPIGIRFWDDDPSDNAEGDPSPRFRLCYLGEVEP